MTNSTKYPDLYKEWLDAGLQEIAFRYHLAAIGAVPATSDDLLDLVSQTVRQVGGILDNLRRQP